LLHLCWSWSFHHLAPLCYIPLPLLHLCWDISQFLHHYYNWNHHHDSSKLFKVVTCFEIVATSFCCCT
jgi:hypothetical protein